MQRRTFLQLIGVTFLPLPDQVMGEKTEGAHIQLYNGDEPVSEPLPVEFRWNSRMEVELRPDRAIHVDRAILRAPECGERVQDFIHLNVSSMDSLTITWSCLLV